MTSQSPVLLTTASYHGTLAAVRNLGHAGIPITLAYSSWLGPSCWSRYVTQRRRSPSPVEGQLFVEWLLDFAKGQPRHVLCPTCDDTAWLYARYRDELSERYHLSGVSVDAVYGVLNKQQLYASCRSVGIDTPEAWFPRCSKELEALADDLPFPVMIKPKTQILYPSRAKGDVVENRSELSERYASMSALRYAPPLDTYDPDVAWPMLQEYCPEAAGGIYNLAGFVTPTGEAMVLRASTKILQHPRRLGTGICFERSELEPELARKLLDLCHRLGYYGVFEVEFVRRGDRFLLVDFNPRFYGEMAFEIERGLQLPQLAYALALGDHETVSRLCRECAEEPSAAPHTHADRLRFEILVRSQALSGVLSAPEARAWREWYQGSNARRSDPVVDPDDWVPALIDALSCSWSYVRHPRSFLRSIVLDKC